MSINEPFVSIVVTTRNEESNIENCLLSIQEQSYKNVEIIVVDNKSTDRTKELASHFTDLVFNKGPERSAQRNYGMIDVAKGEYVMFVDADMILAPKLVEACIRTIQAGGFSALHIPEIILGSKYFSRVRRFERSFYDGTVVDGARFFKKDVFVKVGGFDPSMSGPEDWDIDKKIKHEGRIGLLQKNLVDLSGWSLWRFIEDRGIHESWSDVIFHNETEFSLKRYLAKKAYYSASFDAYITKWGKDDPDLKKQFGLWYRYFGIFLENNKWKRMFRRLDLAFGMYFLRFLVGVVYLVKGRVD